MRYLPLSLLLACGSENGLNGIKPNAGADSDLPEESVPDTEKPDPNSPCDALSGTAHDVDLNTECDVSLQTGSFTPVVEYHFGTTSFCGPPAVGQIVDSNGSGAIDSDDMPAILLYQGTQVVALKGDNSGEYWRSARSNLGQDGGFAIGDLDGDGWPEVVAVNSQVATALNGRNGNVFWTSPDIARSLDVTGYNFPSIADMDADGTPEVTIGNAILNGEDGTIQGQGNKGKGAAPYGGTGSGGYYGTLSVPADLDGDGKMELVTGNAAYKPNGSIKWSNNGPDGLIAVADFDLDGQGEVVMTSGIYVSGLETDGSIAWGPITFSGNLGAPAVDDLDGDGTPEFVFAAQNALIAMRWGGQRFWSASIADSSGAAGPVLFDFEGDGYPEVLYADETSIRFFSGLDGSVKMTSNQHGSYTILETPVVADVDNDDEVEIVLGHCSWNKSLSVYGDQNHSWPPGRKVWNQHAYQISNVGDLGEIPTGSTSNFATYNSFRSGDAGRPPGEWLDLGAEIFDVCEKECEEDKVYVGAWVTNAGNIEASAGIPVSLRAGAGGTILATEYTTQPIPPGKTGEALTFVVSAAALGGNIPVVVANRDASGAGATQECETNNNIASWLDPVCAN